MYSPSSIIVCARNSYYYYFKVAGSRAMLHFLVGGVIGFSDGTSPLMSQQQARISVEGGE